MKTSIRHGSIIKCDVAKCKEQFVSYSMARMVRPQAAKEGWLRVWAWQITKDDSPKLKKDVCPDHAPIAVAAEGKRKEMLAAERAEAKAKRAELAKAKAEVVAAERAKKKAELEAARAAKRTVAMATVELAKTARKAARDAARVTKDGQKKIDRAQRKADKLSIEVHGAVVHVATVPDDPDPASETGDVSPYPIGGA